MMRRLLLIICGAIICAPVLAAAILVLAVEFTDGGQGFGTDI
ncbi:hypothetical protein [Mycolicibacterium thermoresistibile]|uniref:Uncharacterized protein n=1 Tax=Mycolicibacterium thermoresistibile (strain ATCC 19527 / DSM 44167 / CIP 105390 / JCM 6362 / NCTC 10409 / 316) TaxID=1078020 RepID=G7CF47_MYCT3|nr:hypothetical protein [Mycolicibacterium thermoresistibile]EHI13126.1 hypothetical protein KEK_08092 [Mycolicibacterium thermoresistibile ATCC 19527]SNW20314.1 Uncharacterised protein [Mycolicibacterium thermoresistibile]